jgi:hypothetical protein
MSSPATIEPSSFTKGDSVSWIKSLSEYPASEWTLAYAIRGAVSLNITAAAHGNEYDVAISATQSNTLTAGTYWWQAVVTKGAERITVDNGQFIVTPSLQDANAGYDGRSHVKKVLDALEAIIEKRATLDQQSYAIAGRSLSRMTIEEIFIFRDKYKKLYAAELKELDAAKGLGRGNKVQIRFNS